MQCIIIIIIIIGQNKHYILVITDIKPTFQAKY